MISECNWIRYKEAGYDYYVSYKEWKKEFGEIGTYIRAGFPTTKDALTTHIAEIKSRDTVELDIYTLL